MAGWLRGLWMSPSRHEEIVEELRCKIARLERDYVEIAQLLFREAEARRRAERIRDELQRSRAASTAASGNVIILHAQRR